jgi:predicted ester cyclase
MKKMWLIVVVLVMGALLSSCTMPWCGMGQGLWLCPDPAVSTPEPAVSLVVETPTPEAPAPDQGQEPPAPVAEAPAEAALDAVVANQAAAEAKEAAADAKAAASQAAASQAAAEKAAKEAQNGASTTEPKYTVATDATVWETTDELVSVGAYKGTEAVKVVEVSPDGKHVKIQTANGWIRSKDVLLDGKAYTFTVATDATVWETTDELVSVGAYKGTEAVKVVEVSPDGKHVKIQTAMVGSAPRMCCWTG